MAITRAQIAKQLLAKGGRTGFRVGTGEGKDTSGRDYGGSPDRDFGGRDERRPDMLGVSRAVEAPNKPKEQPNLLKRLGLAAINRMADIQFPFLPGGKIDFVNAPDFVQPQDFGPANQRLLYRQMMAQGPRTMDTMPTEEDEEEKKLEGLRLIFRAEGGSMNDQIRQAMLFGGAAKAVKKAVRGVKKVAKSPIGKAAIVGAGIYGLGGGFGSGFKFGNLPGAGLFKSEGLKNFFLKDATEGFALKNLTGKGIGAAITAASLLPFFGLGTGDESEKEAQSILKTQGIDIDAARESILNAGTPQDFRARAFAAEGGSMDEPVAKKTMPLLDMGGQEMDLRAEGGFVPIGRMEKADDVPARLSKNEFVFTADAVRNAGEGDVDKGAEVMYNMMKNLEAGGEVSEESQGLEGARRMFQTSQRLEEVL
jgi:hypothetical protein